MVLLSMGHLIIYGLIPHYTGIGVCLMCMKHIEMSDGMSLFVSDICGDQARHSVQYCSDSRANPSETSHLPINIFLTAIYRAVS